MSALETKAEATLPVLGCTMRIRVYQHGADLVVALVHRTDRPADEPLVRVHSQCLTGDTLGSARCDCGPQLRASLSAIAAVDYGILVYLPSHEGRGIGLVNKIRAYALQDDGLDTIEANVALRFPVDVRHYGPAVTVLADMGVTRLRLLTNNPDKVQALRSAGIEVTRVAMPVFVSEHNRHYLATKQNEMGHVFPEVYAPFAAADATAISETQLQVNGHRLDGDRAAEDVS